MNRMTPLYLSALCQVKWQCPENFVYPHAHARIWLQEQGSLSQMMAQRCQQLSVSHYENQWLDARQLACHETSLLGVEKCLLRQVVITGDLLPWVLGRTLIPESSLADQPYDLTQQGNTLLGLTVFSSEHVRRDGLQVGWAVTEQGRLLARRSRLWMNDKPMLVAELFLPDCPVYTKENV